MRWSLLPLAAVHDASARRPSAARRRRRARRALRLPVPPRATLAARLRAALLGPAGTPRVVHALAPLAACLTLLVGGGVAMAHAPTDGERPALPDDAVRFTPPAEYVAWWQATARCADVATPVPAVRWYVVPNVRRFHVPGAGWVGAYYQGAPQRIVLAGEEAMDGPVVRHEMLHALLDDAVGHPPALFQGRCAEVVSCRQECRAGTSEPVARARQFVTRVRRLLD